MEIGTPVVPGGRPVDAPEVLDCFDNIVLNAGNTFRLQEECGLTSCSGLCANGFCQQNGSIALPWLFPMNLPWLSPYLPWLFPMNLLDISPFVAGLLGAFKRWEKT